MTKPPRRARLSWVSFLTLAAMLGSASFVSAAPDKSAAKPKKPLSLSAQGKGAGKGKTDKQVKSSKQAIPSKEAKPSKGSGQRQASAKPVPTPRARPATAQQSPSSAPRNVVASAVPTAIGTAAASSSSVETHEAPRPLEYAPAAAPSASDIESLKEAVALARRGKNEAASERKAQVRDLVGQKLIEWTILRTSDDFLSFARYAAFVNANPTWPGFNAIQRRAEAQLWQQNAEAGTVLAFFSKHAPLSGKGRLAMARALVAAGDRGGAQRLVRETWRTDPLSEDLETTVLEQFGALLSRGDHEARLASRLFADDFGAAARAAKRLGGHRPDIVRAAIAVEKKAANAGALLESVSPDARTDPAYMFSRARWLRRSERIAEAAQVMLAVPRDSNGAQDSDDWWIERRLLVRLLLDADNPQAAYRLARDAAPPSRGVYRVDQLFTAGWISLRFLNDPNTAMRHFSEMARSSDHPHALGRAGYWLGRTAEALGRHDEARRHYQAGAAHATTYYGQLARARLGHGDVGLRRPPALTQEQRLSARQSEVVRAVEMLYASGHGELVASFVTDIAERVSDPAALAVIAETTARHKDARAMLMLGKGAVARGLAFDHYAFPNVGLPKVASIGPEVDHGLIYSIARQESAFNPEAVSIAKAMGLMQVTAATGRYIARKFGVTFDAKKLRHDPVYNTQMGAAEIADLVNDYNGNYVLAFVAYNAGRGRVKQWVERFGDPRDPKVDAVDWAERIPFSETRNYVQRVMENLQIYRARFGQGARLTIEADLRGSPRQ
jgi:soluble lytic murein transglycosylase